MTYEKNPFSYYKNIQLINGGIKTDHPELFGVPASFSGMSEMSKQIPLLKGQLNKVRLRPRILTEYSESSRTIIETIDSSTIVGQGFKHSQDNINGIYLTLESADSLITHDNFETYTSSTEVQSVWVADNNNVLLETTIISPNNSSTKSMKLNFNSSNDEFVDTISSTNLSGVTFNIDYRQTDVFDNMELSLFIGDGTNTKSIKLPVSNKDLWQTFTIDETGMSEDGAGTTSATGTTSIGFRVDKKKAGNFGYIDNLTYRTIPGSIDLRLWDMGTNPLSGGTTRLSGGTQYTTLGDLGVEGTTTSFKRLNLQGGKRLYHIEDFVAGTSLEIPSNSALTPNNYFAITLHYVDTDVSVYGPDPTFNIDYYTNGFAFSATTTGVTIDQLGTNKDLMFGIFYADDVYITKTRLIFRNVPGTNALTNQFIEDENMNIVDIIAVDHRISEKEDIHDLTFRPIIMNKGGKLEAYYNDDATDSNSFILYESTYLFQPPIVNG